jgi:hypothetical protein
VSIVEKEKAKPFKADDFVNSLAEYLSGNIVKKYNIVNESEISAISELSV